MGNAERRHYGFDEWRQLAETDPAAFEAQRRRVLDAVILSAPRRRRARLRRLQWRIDQTRSLSANPMAACVRISGMMWDSVHGPHGLVRAMNLLASRWDGAPRPLPIHREGRVLRFPRT